MGLFSAVIDRSPVDKFGQAGNAAALTNYATTGMAQSQELYNMNSARNQMFKQQNMESAFDVQAQQGMMAQRQAARSGQAFTPAGMDSSAAVRNQVQNQWGQQMMAQQSQAGSFMGQAAEMQGQAGSMRNSLNSLYRQQQEKNQAAKQQAKAAKLSMVTAAFGAVAGPAMGAIGGGLAGMVGGGGFQAGASGAAGLGNSPVGQAYTNTSNFQLPGGGFSDITLKENIELVGKSNSGINIYHFDYKDKSYGEGRYKGVMAQEVPNASFKNKDGYLWVDYNKIDVNFRRIV